MNDYKLLSENLTDETIANLKIDIPKVIASFVDVQLQGISKVNLKLAIDLLNNGAIEDE